MLMLLLLFFIVLSLLLLLLLLVMGLFFFPPFFTTHTVYSNHWVLKPGSSPSCLGGAVFMPAIWGDDDEHGSPTWMMS